MQFSGSFVKIINGFSCSFAQYAIIPFLVSRQPFVRFPWCQTYRCCFCLLAAPLLLLLSVRFILNTTTGRFPSKHTQARRQSNNYQSPRTGNQITSSPHGQQEAPLGHNSQTQTATLDCIHGLNTLTHTESVTPLYGNWRTRLTALPQVGWMAFAKSRFCTTRRRWQWPPEIWLSFCTNTHTHDRHGGCSKCTGTRIVGWWDYRLYWLGPRRGKETATAAAASNRRCAASAIACFQIVYSRSVCAEPRIANASWWYRSLFARQHLTLLWSRGGGPAAAVNARL